MLIPAGALDILKVDERSFPSITNNIQRHWVISNMVLEPGVGVDKQN